ncbi:MAG: cytochrome P450 [Solirubrobacteraceae bacterium]
MSATSSHSRDRIVVDFDHHATEASRDRYTVLSRVGGNPVFYTEAHGGYWVVTTHQLTKHVLRTPEVFSSLKHPDGTGGVTIPTAPGPRLIPAEADGAYHRQLRKILTPKFNRAAAAEMRPRVERVVRQTIDQVIEKCDFDVVHDISDVIPAGVMVEYLGFPEEMRVPFIKSVQAALSVMPLAGPAELADPSEELKAGIESFMYAVNAIREVVARRREEPMDDVVSYLAAAEQTLDDDELLWLTFTLFVGGAENPAAFISNAMIILAEDEALRRRLTRQPDLIPGAIDEFLRVITAGVSLARNVVQDVELGGQQLSAGDRVLLWLPAANHDIGVFSAPAVIDVERSPCPHVAFGDGPHVCVGSWLARLEFQLLFEELLKRMPDYRLHIDRAERFDDAATMYGWRTLPATV